MFSFTLQMSDGRAVPFLQYVASLAIIEAIESCCTSKVRSQPLKTIILYSLLLEIVLLLVAFQLFKQMLKQLRFVVLNKSFFALLLVF